MVHSVHIDSITILPNRQRQEFDPEALVDLANSITAHGLLHPPVIRETPSGYVLVAGERRLRAMRDIWAFGEGVRCNGVTHPENYVPCLTLGELDPLAAEEAELDENLRRVDLSWQERASAISRLHNLRVKQAAAIGEVHSVADTTREVYPEKAAAENLGGFHTNVRENLILADHLGNTEVAKAKSPKDAIKILKKQEESRKNRELAERIGVSFDSSVHTLLNTDCITWLESCPANSFDVICTDPPYGMGADNFGDGGGKLGNSTHVYDDSPEEWEKLVNQLCPALFHVAKPEAHAYIFCDIERFHQLKSAMESAGWYVFRTPLIAHKPDSGRVPLPEHGPRRQWEAILYAIKGKKPVLAIYSDVLSHRLEENLGHGANKPVSLFHDLLRRSVRPGDTVLDCFAGTGTIFPAAHQLKAKATGIELNPEYYAIAVKRLNALDSQPEML